MFSHLCMLEFEDSFLCSNNCNAFVSTNDNDTQHTTSITIEVRCDTGANYFVVKDVSFLHDVLPVHDIILETGRTKDSMRFKGTLNLLLRKDNTPLIVK